jgi:hypothetical protein
MLGIYNNFPKGVHKIVDFSTSISEKRLQRAVVEAFHKLNGRTFSLEEVTTPSIPQCTVIFELGIAQENDFSYLDDEEANRVLKAIEKKTLSTMDFLCVIRYYKVQNGTKTPLKFDYYMLRFMLSKKFAQMQIFHEKGLMHVSPKDLPQFITNMINAEFAKKALKVSRII